MAGVEQCEKCGEWLLGGVGGLSAADLARQTHGGPQVRHECPPVWWCWSPDDDENSDDAVPMYASGHEEAAQRWAEQRDRDGDYMIVRGSSKLVFVRGPNDAEYRYRVSGEFVASYSAEELALDGV